MLDDEDIVDAEVVSSHELVPAPRPNVGHTLDREVGELMGQRDALVADLEQALNWCRSYQAAFARIDMPDPNFVPLRAMLRKYKMPWLEPSRMGRIYVDGHDITHHPDSISGSATDELGGGPERIELVRDEETGAMGLRRLPRGSDE